MLSKLLIVSAFVVVFLIGCAPNKNSADSFSETLVCGMEPKKIIKTAVKLNASNIFVEDDLIDISFGNEAFFFHFDKTAQLIAVDRVIHNYFLFLEASDFKDFKGVKTILICRKEGGQVEVPQ